MTNEERRGGCLCGEVRFLARGEPLWVAHCHCESCRRATSAAFATYAGYPRDAVRWTAAQPAQYPSSPGVVRRFCPRCGSPMSFEGERFAGELHLFLASFEDPASLEPELHVHAGEKLPWVHLADDLPRYRTTSDGKTEDAPVTTSRKIEGRGC
jgi:hypothetical protein